MEQGLKTVSTRLQHHRMQKEMSVAGLAEKSGVSRSAIHKIEAGSNPTMRTIAKLASALGEDSLYLLNGSLAKETEKLEAENANAPSRMLRLLRVPFALHTLALKMNMAYPHVYLLMEIANKLHCLRADGASNGRTEQDWSSLYRSLSRHFDRELELG